MAILITPPPPPSLLFPLHNHTTQQPSLCNSLFLSLCKFGEMATLQFVAFSSPITRCSAQPRTLPGLSNLVVHSCTSSAFNGQSLQLSRSSLCRQSQKQGTSRLRIVMVQPSIQFIQGIDEQTIPDVKLTKSRDGTNGMATFTFSEPSVFDSSSVVGDITGLYMIDEEGVLQSVDVSAKFMNGKPAGIEAKYVMRTARDWDRFMRFMERYANEKGLSFIKK